MTPQELDSIALRAQEGEETAMNRTLQALERDLQYQVSRYPHVCGTHEDLLQEGRLAVLEAIQGFDPKKASFRTWANNIARRAMLKMLIHRISPVRLPEHVVQSRIAKWKLGDEESPLTPPVCVVEDFEPPDPKSIASFESFILQEELARLPEKERRALLLRYMDNLKPREVADAMELNEQQVYYTMRKGLAQLRQRLT